MFKNQFFFSSLFAFSLAFATPTHAVGKDEEGSAALQRILALESARHYLTPGAILDLSSTSKSMRKFLKLHPLALWDFAKGSLPGLRKNALNFRFVFEDRMSAALQLPSVERSEWLMKAIQEKNLSDSTRITLVRGLSEEAIFSPTIHTSFSFTIHTSKERRAAAEILIQATQCLPVEDGARTDLLYALTQRKTIDMDCRFKAAEALPPGEIQTKAYLSMAGDKTMGADARIKAAQALPEEEETRTTALTQIALDRLSVSGEYRVIAARALPTALRDQILYDLTQEKKLFARERLAAARSLSDGSPMRIQALQRIARDSKSTAAPYRIAAARDLPPELRNPELRVLIQGKNISFKDRLRAAKTLPKGDPVQAEVLKASR